MITLGAAAAEFGFNPSQMRGPDGKWIHVGGAVRHAEHGLGTVTGTHALGKVSVRFDRGGLKKVSGKELHPSSHDPLGGEINEDILHKRHEARKLGDIADEEAAHRRNLRRQAADNADEEAAHRRHLKDIADQLHADRNPHDRRAERRGR